MIRLPLCATTLTGLALIPVTDGFTAKITRVATLFPNEASLLRLASAVLSEISDDWETERAYLNMEAR